MEDEKKDKKKPRTVYGELPDGSKITVTVTEPFDLDEVLEEANERARRWLEANKPTIH